MIDRQRRDEFAEAIDAFLEGRIAGADFHQRAGTVARRSAKAGDPDSAIAACRARLWEYHAILPRGVLSGYADLGTHDAEELPDEQWEQFRRCAVFLRSDLGLEWPESTWSPYDDVVGGTDIKRLIVLIVAVVAALFTLAALLSAKWGLLIVWGLVGGAALTYFLRIRETGEESPAANAADPTAFPFTSQEEFVEERKRQGYTTIGPATPVDEP